MGDVLHQLDEWLRPIRMGDGRVTHSIRLSLARDVAAEIRRLREENARSCHCNCKQIGDTTMEESSMAFCGLHDFYVRRELSTLRDIIATLHDHADDCDMAGDCRCGRNQKLREVGNAD